MLFERNSTQVALALLLTMGFWAVFAQPTPTPQARQLAVGKQVYEAQCASCHALGAQSLVGSAPLSRLTRYRTAQGLFDYISLAMPPNNPGSLSDAEYWAVIAFILSENKILPANALIEPGNARQVMIRLPAP